MKSDVVSKKMFTLKVFALVMVFAIYLVGEYLINNYRLYNDIQVYVNKTAAVEYGSNNYDIMSLVSEVEGKVVSVKNDLDTSVVGSQEVLLEVKNGNVVKTVPIRVSVVDVTKPIIAIKDDYVSITSGDTYDVFSNIVSVKDDIDGDLAYNEGSDGAGYNLIYDDITSVGSHNIVIKAKDNSGNISESSFTLEVKPAPVYIPVYYNLPPNVHGSDMVATAYSLIGAPYSYGGTGQNGFDCSGFVQYVYSTVGIGISRSTSSQLYDGRAVSLESAQPGDIIIWGSNGFPTHSALYVGNGQMIHATNPRDGVILSNVNFWMNASGTGIISIRRV